MVLLDAIAPSTRLETRYDPADAGCPHNLPLPVFIHDPRCGAAVNPNPVGHTKPHPTPHVVRDTATVHSSSDRSHFTLCKM